VELKKLYREKNGFVAFESTFRIYDIDTLVNINSLIQSELSIGGIFFGDNALGDGFCIKGNDFYRYDFELDELEFIGKGIEEFSHALLSKYNYYTGIWRYITYGSWNTFNDYFYGNCIHTNDFEAFERKLWNKYFKRTYHSFYTILYDFCTYWDCFWICNFSVNK